MLPSLENLVIIMFVGILARVPFANFPMDEDFGFYAYTAHFKNRGIKLVKGFWGTIFPCMIYIKMGMYKICKGDVKNIRFLFALYNVLTALAVYGLASHMYGSDTGLLAALFFSVFSAAPHLGVYSVSAEKYYILPITLSIYLFLLGMDHDSESRLVLSGVLLGIAFAAKPVVIVNAAAFSLFILVYGGGREVAFFMSGFFLAIVTNFLVIGYIFRKEIRTLWIQNRLRIMAAVNHVGVPLDILERFVTDFLPLGKETLFLWVAITPFFSIALHEQTPANILLLLWILAAVVTFVGQRAFWQYQYIPIIHVFSLTSAVATMEVLDRYREGMDGNSMVVSMLLFLSLLYSLKNLLPYYLPSKDWKKLLNSFRKMDQYLYVRELGKYIRNNTESSDFIYAWGPWTHIYLLADRPSCEKSAFHFIRPYQEFHEIQYDETMQGIIEKKPKFIIQIFSNFNREYLNKLTGLNYEIDCVFFNRYVVYKLHGEDRKKERLYKEDEPWEAKKEKLEALSAGTREHKIYPYYYERGETEKYLKEFDNTLAVNPYDITTLVCLGIFYRENLDYDKALEYFQRALAVKKDQSWVHFEMAVTYQAMEKTDLFQEELVKAKKHTFPYNATSLKRLGAIHRMAGNFEKSIKALNFLQKHYPPLEWMYGELGMSCKEAGRTKEAIEYFKKEMMFYPNGEWKRFHLGVAYREAAMFKEAEEYMKKELALYPVREWKNFHLGMVYREAGMFKEAEEHMKKEFALYPVREWKYCDFGLMYLKWNKPDSAVSYFEEELKLYPEKPYVHYLAASALKRMGVMDKAAEYFKRVIESATSCHSDQAGSHYHIGTILLEKDNSQGAIAEFEKCLQLLPHHEMAAKCLNQLRTKT